MINYTWLNTFCRLVEVGHFTRTAEVLFMTQSGVSQHIKKLEQQLNTPLLVRDGKQFSLTDAGLKLYQHGTALLKNTTELEAYIKQDTPYAGTIKVASPGSVGLKLYPHLLDIQTIYPELTIEYNVAPNADIEDRLHDRKIDVGLVTQLNKSNGLSYLPVSVEPLLLVTSYKVKHVDWATLLALGFISHPDAKHHADLLLTENFAEYEGIEQFKQTGFSNQINSILEPVARGFGFTVLPLHAVNAFSQQERIQVHALEKNISETLYFCTVNKALETKRSQFIKQEIRQFLSE
jgi:DNA-binding transcriptional LysR family regulator